MQYSDSVQIIKRKKRAFDESESNVKDIKRDYYWINWSHKTKLGTVPVWHLLAASLNTVRHSFGLKFQFLLLKLLESYTNYVAVLIRSYRNDLSRIEHHSELVFLISSALDDGPQGYYIILMPILLQSDESSLLSQLSLLVEDENRASRKLEEKNMLKVMHDFQTC